jgi:hypothetical protein
MTIENRDRKGRTTIYEVQNINEFQVDDNHEESVHVRNNTGK